MLLARGTRMVVLGVHGRRRAQEAVVPAAVVQLQEQVGVVREQRRGMASKKHKKFLKAAKGFRNRRSRSFRVAFPAVLKAWQKAYVGRKLKKRRMKTQWIQQLNAGARMYGIGYAQFVHLAAKARIGLNRKVLADLAVSEPLSFKAVVDVCKHPS